MQIAVSSLSFSREIPDRLSLLNLPAWAGSQGIPLIEIEERHLPSTDPTYLTDLLRACNHANVQIAALALANDFTDPDADKLFQQVQHVRHMLYDVAAPLKAQMVRVFMGMSDVTEAGDERAQETFRNLVPDLQATGITMVLENHAREQTPPDKIAAIIRGVGSPLFAACADMGSLPVDRRYMTMNQLAPLARIVHARSYVFDLDGEETTVDYKSDFALLTEHGFNGVISILYEGFADAERGVRDTKALIEKYWYHPEAGRTRRAA
jgi:sugar phosphate isomerase/epimerase